jgi:glycosyltransferase involved in cell wall biosynthesis
VKVAIVHDWLIGGGAERVVQELHNIYPEAPIYTSYCTYEWRQKLDGKVITSYLQHWPFAKLRKFLPPLRGLWFSHLDLRSYDLVISSSGAEAKFVKVNKPTVHIAYIHAPTHYYWNRYNDYMQHPGFGKLDPLARLGLKILVGPMRRWDYRAAQAPDFLIANSSYTKAEIKKYYDRDAVVIYPPVDIERFKSASKEPRHGFVTTGRQTPYKRLDLAVRACSELNLPLIVLGFGPDHAKLKRLAGKSITFLRGKTDEELAEYLKSSLAYIFPGVDDFGIAAVEALAAGTPVIAYKDGGALDYIKSGQTGLFFEPQTPDALKKALQRFNPDNFDPASVAKHAEEFSIKNFHRSIVGYINQTVGR